MTGSATSGADYPAPTGRLTIPTGASRGTITIATTADGVLDAGETLIVKLTGVSTSKGMASVTTTPATTTIVDSGMVTVSAGPLSASEGDALAFPVTLSGKVSSDVVLGWSTSADSAVSDTDYTAVTSGSLTILANATSGTLTVSTTGDTLAEADETLTVTITGPALPSGVSLGVATATGTIRDDDRLTAAVAADELTVTEGSPASFTVTLTGATSTAEVVVAYSIEGTATLGDDYTAPSPLRLTIAASVASGTITIPTIGDGVLEPGETLKVSLVSASTAKGAAMVSETHALAMAAITDPGMVTVSVGPASASEGDVLAFPATLSGRVSSDVVLGWSTAAVTAVSGTDYTAVSSGALTIEAGDASGTLTVSTKEDTLAEANETFQVTIATSTAPPGVSLGVASASGTIQDDDLLTALVAAETVNVAEGSPASFTVTLTGGTSTAEVMVTYSLGGTATEGRDYEAPAGRLTIGPGAGSAPIEIARPGRTMSRSLTRL